MALDTGRPRKADRRWFPRVRRGLSVRYTAQGQACQGVTSDVSVTGLHVVTRGPQPAPGESLVLELLPASGEAIRLRGRVPRLEHGNGDERRGGFAFALDSYSEPWERLALAFTSPDGGESASSAARMRTDIPASPAPVRILLVDASERDERALRDAASRIEIGTFRVECIEGAREALATLAQRRHDIAFVSWRIAPCGGLGFIRSAVASGCEIPIVLLTNTHDRILEVEAVREGAADAIDLAHLDADTLERTIRCVLERARCERDRHASERELASLYDRAPCGDLVLDEKGVILRVNETALLWLDDARESVVGHHFTDLLEPGCVPRFHEEVRWFLEPGRLRDLPLDVRRRDGSVIAVSASASVVSAAGMPVRSRWTLLEAGARREREAFLRRMTLALDAMPLGVVVTDGYGTLVYANRTFAALVGRGAKELAGADLRELFPGLVDRALGGAPDAPLVEETRIARSDGTVTDVRVVCGLVREVLGETAALVCCCEPAPRARSGRATREACERLVERLGSAESMLRSLSELLLEEMDPEENDSSWGPDRGRS